MAIRTILYHPDPRLKKKCAPVETVDADVRQLMEDMLETMYDAPGVGLAAPQIGVLRRVIVMDVVKDEEAPREPLMMANPRVVAASEARSVYEEGCLSIPDEFADVERPAEVRVAYLDENGEAREIDCTGLLATCVQHEIDHLDGKLFIDYLGPVKRSMITGRMKKRKRERATA